MLQFLVVAVAGWINQQQRDVIVVRMATENREGGDTRSRGARGNLGHQVARGPLANVRKERGLEPVSDRKTRTTWLECLAAHGDVLAAADCFTVEVWTPRGLTP